MNLRTIRRVWFIGLWFLLPWPLLVFVDAFVPAARFVLLFVVTATVAIAEGASGPVGLVLALFLGMGGATTFACWLLARLISWALYRQAAGVQHGITWGFLGVALLLSLVLDPYRTPFGRALRGGLLDVLS